MRYTALSSLMLTFLGALLMLTAADPTPADGQEKKDPALKAPFDQFVKVEAVTAKGDAFVKEGVPAYRTTSKLDITFWRVPKRALGVGTNFAGLKSVVVTDKDGKKHTCDKVGEVGGGTNGEISFRIVTPKP